MKKKDIAFVVNGLYGGGAERVLQVFLDNFDRRKYDITLINHREEDINNEFYPTDIKYISILKNAEKKRSKVGWILAKIYNKINLIVYDNFSPHIFRMLYLRDKFDVEIAFIEGYATRIVSGGRSTKKIAWVHIDLKLYPWTDIAFRSMNEQIKCYSFFDEIVSVSKSVQSSVEELFSHKSIVIYNPIDINKIKKEASLFTVDKEKKGLVFISVGRLVPQKGYDRLIPIIGKLVTEGFSLNLWIVGEGPERKRLEDLIQEWKLEGIVKLLGYQSNPYPYIKAADWFVFSSRYEGYGLVVAEALILETPVVSVMCAEMTQLLGEYNQWGVIVDNEDVALLNGMRNILENPELTAKYTARAIKGGNRFSLERPMNEIYRIIDN
ncbi:glycosyltransferase [Dysgonomonas sp. Marseille-P4677]|uniref:glycosyltransferase n=1 Tax=Dysgonomonas sp. Marseille-P4677 TaxID=2364790 RepID=UPI001912B937|nr:glycosyltransferase [Dysgonomonas sp. Marseille-P4677]MBK5721506.1 glycosyltransferase [Dysgonomonas sp. Marseille-P4677]